MEDEGWTFSPVSDFAILLKDLCSEASEHGIPFFYTFGPFSTKYMVDEVASKAVRTKVDAIDRFLQGENKNCRFLRGSRVLSSFHLANDTHVNRIGAEFFTKQLAKELAPYLR